MKSQDQASAFPDPAPNFVVIKLGTKREENKCPLKIQMIYT